MPKDMLPAHVHRVKARGKWYYYLHPHRGTALERPRIRLPDDPKSPEFWAAYADAMRLPPPTIKTDTFAALIEAWQASPDWASMSTTTQYQWSRHCRAIAERWGPLEVRGLQPKHVLAWRDEGADKPATMNNRLRCLRSMLSWSVPRDWRPDNPCRDVPLLPAGHGYAPWPWEVIEEVRGTLKLELWWCVALALYTGQRLGDVLAMRWSAINPAGLIAVTQHKTGKALLIPIHRDLQPVLDGIPKRAVTILTSGSGKPWRHFQTAWAQHKPETLKERGLVFHGLRKSAVVTLLEAGCTDAEVASITGQSRQMIEHYAKKVNQEKLARSAILRWETSR